MELYISDGRHLKTDVDERVEQIENAIGSPDAVFEEDRTQSHSYCSRAKNWVISPLLLVGISAYLFILTKASRIFSADHDIIEQLADNHETKRYPVDKPVHSTITEKRPEWGLANWFLVIVPMFLILLSNSLFVLVISVLALVAGIGSLMLSFLAGTMTERNLYMIEQIDRISEEQGFEQVCLVTGGRHEDGLQDVANRFDGIDVIEK